MTRLRAGLVGLGAMGRHHARILNSLSGVDLVGVADPAASASDTSSLAGRHVRDLEGLLDLGLDYAVVAVPTSLHLEVGLALAEAGVAALIEKPLAADLASCLLLEQAFATRDLVAGVGHVERYNPAIRELRTRLRAGTLGAVLQVATRRQGPFPGRVADVGVIKDLATHDIDLTAWIADSRYEWVASRSVTGTGRPHEDMVAAIGQLAGGVITSHLVNWLSPLKERTTIVTCEAGALVADTLTADLTLFANGTARAEWSRIADFRGVTEGDVTRYAIDKPEPLRVEHERFRDRVLGKEAEIVTLAEGARTVSVAEALLSSSSSSQAIRLPA